MRPAVACRARSAKPCFSASSNACAVSQQLYRALVWAKVATIRLDQTRGDDSEAMENIAQADHCAFRGLARQTGGEFALLAPQATPAQLRERIEGRGGIGRDASEATPDVLARQMRAIEPLRPDEGSVVRHA